MNKEKQYKQSMENIVSNKQLSLQEKRGALAHLKSLIMGTKTFSSPSPSNTTLLQMVNEDKLHKENQTNTNNNSKVFIKVDKDNNNTGLSSPILIAVSTIMFGTLVILMGIIIGTIC